MSALALDEFSLEMRLHYIETTLESLKRFNTYGDFLSEVKLAVEEWAVEARSNEMTFFANFLEVLKIDIASGALSEKADSMKVSKILNDYLNLLSTEEDSQKLYEQYHNSFSKNGGERHRHYLQCVTHANYFIVPVNNVTEIVGHKKVFPLPLAQTGVRGLTSFRGHCIPVINLIDFGFNINNEKVKEDAENDKSCFVVCDYKDSFFALEVHRTEDVLEMDSSQFQACCGSSFLSPVVDRFVIKDGKSLMLLDVGKLLKYE